MTFLTTLPYDEKTKTLVHQPGLFMKKLQLVEIGIITLELIVFTDRFDHRHTIAVLFGKETRPIDINGE